MIADRVIKKGPSFFIMLFAVLCLLFPLPIEAGGGVHVKSIQHWNSEGYSRVVINLSGPLKFDEKFIGKPDRLFIDMDNCVISNYETIPVDNGILRAVRAAQYDKNTVRVVLDLNKFKNYKVFPLDGPFRVVVDVYSDSEQKAVPHLDVRKVVVIDPGHGGHDPGAVGYRGLKEKDVVLDIALRLKKMLDKEGFEAVLTRSNDVYLSLEERTAIANRRNADLFVSVHANASTNKNAKGMETYLLNWTDDEEAIKVAARENAISVESMRESRSELGIILASLELQNKRDESLKLANYIQGDSIALIGGKYRRVVDLGVKQALFYVLVGAKMPSALVEVSFITNPEEAVRLKSPAYRENLSDGIAKGIKTYFIKSLPVQEMASRQ